VYALGVIWYQLLTGDLLTGRPGGTRWPGRLSAAGVPAAQVELLAMCLEDDPADRPADAGALAERCAALLAPPAEARPARAAKPVPRALPRQFVNALGMRCVLIQAGSFLMGSPPDEAMRRSDEGPVRSVYIEQPFYLGAFPVTQKEYDAVMRSKPAHFQRKSGGGPEHPVEQVTWEEAVEFCRKLTARAEEKRAGRVYRLPSEAEWEYACRAGTTTTFAFGAALSSDQANFDGSHPYGSAEAGPFLQATTKVGSYEPNAWGLYDMHGNVWEWCADWYALNKERALRGGSWNNSGHLCRAARRQKYAPDYRGDNVGFRVAVEVRS
jgi:formylglycine-generating enzyme required for sulfatase activity